MIFLAVADKDIVVNFDFTCIKVLHKEASDIAARRLLERIANPTGPTLEVYIRTELVTGSSVSQLTK